VSGFYGAVTGSLRSPEGQFQLTPTTTAHQAILQKIGGTTKKVVNSTASDLVSTPLSIPSSIVASAADRAKAGTNTEIDLLVVYTPGMAARYGGTVGVVSRLKTLVAPLNDALTQSQVPQTINLILPTEIVVSETLNHAQILGGLSIDTTVSNLRKAAGADLVMLIRPYNLNSHLKCSEAYLLGASTGITSADAVNAFSSGSDSADINGAAFSCGDLKFAQAIGHNLGLQYDRANATGLGSTPSAYGYIAPNNAFSTTMALGPNKIPRFSNPNIL
jgi:Metallo-peptidase family M12B Reprolysin-like